MQRMKAVLAVLIALTLLIGTYPLAPLSASTASITFASSRSIRGRPRVAQNNR